MKKSAPKNSSTIFHCFHPDGSKESISALCAEDARRIFLARFGFWPTQIEKTSIEAPLLPGSAMTALSGILAPQKEFKPLSQPFLLFFAWALVLEPLSAWFFPFNGSFFSPENLFSRTGHAAFLIVTALALHYLRIFAHNYLIYGDPHYQFGRMKILYTAPLSGILLGLAVSYLPHSGGQEPHFLSLPLGLSAFLFPWFFALRGGLKSLNRMNGFRAFLDRCRTFPYALFLLSLLSFPAILLAAETARYLFIRWFIAPLWPILKDIWNTLLHGNPLPAANWGILYHSLLGFLLYGSLLYGTFILSFEVVKKSSQRDRETILNPQNADSSPLRNSDFRYQAARFFFTRLLPGSLLYLLSLLVNYGLNH